MPPRLRLILCRAVAVSALVAGGATVAQTAGYGVAPAYVQAPAPQSGYDTDGQSVDSIEVFFEPLSHYGRWLDSRFGRVWQPGVPPGWRPYTVGHWEAGPYGQTWRSDEPFGWAVFHFGRWAFDPALGWVWLPDTTWGPGWVAWRDGDDVAGWAPLPPQVGVAVLGYNDWGYDQWYQPGWVWVPRGYLYARSLRGAFLPGWRGREAWDHSRGVGRFDRTDGAVIDRSFDPRLRRDAGRDPGRGRGDDGRGSARGDGTGGVPGYVPRAGVPGYAAPRAMPPGTAPRPPAAAAIVRPAAQPPMRAPMPRSAPPPPHAAPAPHRDERPR